MNGRSRSRRRVAGLTSAVLGFKRWPMWQQLPIYLFLCAFVGFPLIKLFVDAFAAPDGSFTLEYFSGFLCDGYYLKALLNSMILSMGTVIAASLLGFAASYFLVRYDFPGRKVFSYLTMVPIIMPPLVGVMGFVFILGRAGTLNVVLMDYLGLRHPINFIYGWHGVLLVETLHLFPLISMNVVDALGKIDASLEEAAESVGSTGLRRLRDITMPLTTPGFVTGALLVFMWTFADFATPLVVGVQNLLAPQAYLNIVQFVDRRLFQMGITIGALLVLMAIVFLVAAKQYIAAKDYATLSYRPVERRTLSGARAWAITGFFAVVLAMAFIPYLGVGLAAFGRGWSLTPFPVEYTLRYFERVIVETPKFVVNTFLYCGFAVILCVLVGVPIAWTLARTRLPGRGLLDALVTLVLALPGTAIGIAYIRAFNVPLPRLGVALTDLWLIMPVVLAVRRLPYTVRSTHGSLLVLHESLEEAARSVGARGMRVFMDITLPLIWKGILAGALFSFMTSIQEAAATILLAVPGWETMTVGIFTFYTSGSINEAAALGFILIVVGAASLFVANRLGGARMGGFYA